MNYCFNCGAKLIEKDQKFCIKCGTKLVEHEDKYKDYLRQSHSKYNQMEGESYNDYLERINSPLKDKIATEDEIEKEKEDYIDYDPLKTYKENNPQINYPKSEREDDDSYEISDTEENIKIIIIFAYSFRQSGGLVKLKFLWCIKLHFFRLIISIPEVADLIERICRQIIHFYGKV